MKKSLSQSVKVLFLAILLAGTVALAQGPVVGPTVAPTVGNAPIPINVSDNPQTREGALTINDILSVAKGITGDSLYISDGGLSAFSGNIFSEKNIAATNEIWSLGHIIAGQAIIQPATQNYPGYSPSPDQLSGGYVLADQFCLTGWNGSTQSCIQDWGATGGQGLTLPTGTGDETLRYDDVSSSWVLSPNMFNGGNIVSIKPAGAGHPSAQWGLLTLTDGNLLVDLVNQPLGSPEGRNVAVFNTNWTGPGSQVYQEAVIQSNSETFAFWGGGSGDFLNVKAGDLIATRLANGTSSTDGQTVCANDVGKLILCPNVVTPPSQTTFSYSFVGAGVGTHTSQWKNPGPGAAAACPGCTDTQFKVPAGVYKIYVHVLGSGGAGGSAVGTFEDVGGGGGAGGYTSAIYDVIPGQTYTIQSASATISPFGANGQQSKFGDFLIADGGLGGANSINGQTGNVDGGNGGWYLGGITSNSAVGNNGNPGIPSPAPGQANPSTPGSGGVNQGWDGQFGPLYNLGHGGTGNRSACPGCPGLPIGYTTAGGAGAVTVQWSTDNGGMGTLGDSHGFYYTANTGNYSFHIPMKAGTFINYNMVGGGGGGGGTSDNSIAQNTCTGQQGTDGTPTNGAFNTLFVGIHNFVMTVGAGGGAGTNGQNLAPGVGFNSSLPLSSSNPGNPGDPGNNGNPSKIVDVQNNTTIISPGGTGGLGGNNGFDTNYLTANGSIMPGITGSALGSGGKGGLCSTSATPDAGLGGFASFSW